MPWITPERSETESDGVSPRRLLFSELFHARTPPSIADRFLRLGAEELKSFYREQTLLSLRLGDDEFSAPISFALNAPEHGVPGKQPVQLQLNEEKWSPPTTIDGYTGPIRAELSRGTGTSTDGQRVRLASLTRKAGIDELVLQPVGYFDCLSTNFAMDHCPLGRSESLRESAQPKGRFEGFASSVLSNNIGVICMVESADGLLVVQRRSSAASIQNRPGGLSASVSGGVDWTDIEELGNTTGVRSLVAGTKRETVEELGVTLRDVRFLGLMREMLRGGKPEAYFYARSALPHSEIAKEWLKSRSKKEATELLGLELHSDRVVDSQPSLRSFHRRVSRILWDVHEQADLTLVTGVLLAATLLGPRPSGGW